MVVPFILLERRRTAVWISTNVLVACALFLVVVKSDAAFIILSKPHHHHQHGTPSFGLTTIIMSNSKPLTKRDGIRPKYDYCDEDHEDDGYFEDDDNDNMRRRRQPPPPPPPPQTRTVGQSRAEKELKSIPLAANDDEGYDDDDKWYDDSLINNNNNKSNNAPLKPVGPRRSMDRFYEYEEAVDEDWDDDDDFDTLSSSSTTPATGNFWSNPLASLDPFPRPPPPPPLDRSRRSPRGRDTYPKSTAEPHERDWSSSSSSQRQQRPSMKRRKTTFRSGTPPPPPPVLDLYNRLFWYGVDDDDDNDNDNNNGSGSSSSSPADPTMFGGTKGKFNGLAYIRDGVGVMPPDQRGRRRPRQKGDDNDDYNNYNNNDEYIIDDDENWDDDDDDDGQEGFFYQDSESTSSPYPPTPPLDKKNGKATKPVVLAPDKPPHDVPQPTTFTVNPTSTRRKRRQGSNENDDNNKRDYNNDQERWTRRQERRQGGGGGGNDWFFSGGDATSSWFRNDNDQDRNKNNENDKKRGRGREERFNRRPEWSPLNALDVFLGLNRERLDAQAQDYNRRMGLVSSSDSDQDEDDDSSTRRSRRRQRQRRPPLQDPLRADGRLPIKQQEYNDSGSWPYRENDDNGDDDKERRIIDYDVVVPAEEDRDRVVNVQPKNQVVQDVEFEKEEPKSAKGNSSNISNRASARRQLSWEERSLAMERVPPAGVPAWGPGGDCGMDARAKAIADALQDVLKAQRAVEAREARIVQAREELTILRVDERLERNKRAASEANLRELGRKIEDASRNLRYAQIRLESAQEELADIEARHWALLRLCDPDQVEKNVNELLREVEELEPVARRYSREKLENNGQSSTTATSNSQNNQAQVKSATTTSNLDERDTRQPDSFSS